jgi:hypothetical protein
MTNPVDPSIYILLQDAIREYGHSRPWWFKQVKQHRLTSAKFAADKRVYLLRSEIKELFSGPTEVEERKSQENAG